MLLQLVHWVSKLWHCKEPEKNLSWKCRCKKLVRKLLQKRFQPILMALQRHRHLESKPNGKGWQFYSLSLVVVAWYGGLYLVVRAFPQCELGVIIIKPPRRARWPGWLLLLEPVRLPASYYCPCPPGPHDHTAQRPKLETILESQF